MKLLLVICILFVSCVVGEVIKHSACTDTAVSRCTVHQVRVNPCPQANQDINTPCKVKRGKSATIEFDYTADFNATEAKGQVYWVSPEALLPFNNMDQNACSFTQCPITQNVNNTYTQKFDTSRKYPTRIFDLKWVLSNVANEEENCCFLMKIRLTR